MSACMRARARARGFGMLSFWSIVLIVHAFGIGKPYLMLSERLRLVADKGGLWWGKDTMGNQLRLRTCIQTRITL